jgi:DNA-binding response OmpR family regulator
MERSVLDGVMTAHVLVVDDDPLICKGLKFNLEQAGYRVVTALNAIAAREHAQRMSLDAAILDISLPGDDGLSLCQYLKHQYNLPVIFLTARHRELDEIIGLEVGADDYITKPFNVDVLLAHLKALLRRSGAASTPMRQMETLTAGPFSLDPVSHIIKKNGQMVTLAPREFDLLQFFMGCPDKVCTADEIIEHVWGTEFIGQPQVLYVQMNSLRRKIEDDPAVPQHLLTLRGVGYKFVP